MLFTLQNNPRQRVAQANFPRSAQRRSRLPIVTSREAEGVKCTEFSSRNSQPCTRENAGFSRYVQSISIKHGLVFLRRISGPGAADEKLSRIQSRTSAQQLRASCIPRAPLSDPSAPVFPFALLSPRCCYSPCLLAVSGP